MMGWGDIFKSVSDFMPSSRTMANIGQAVSPFASLYSANRQAKSFNKSNDLMEKNYMYNKSINDREIAKENMEQSNITNAFSSIFGDGKKRKKKNLDSYAGMMNYQG
jgi:hypothetical protein